MANIELVIKIPKELYESYKGRSPMLGDAGMDMIAQSIANGKPLPINHGDLIDINNIDVIELEDSVHIIRHEKGDEVNVYISAPTIIKANKNDNR